MIFIMCHYIYYHHLSGVAGHHGVGPPADLVLRQLPLAAAGPRARLSHDRVQRAGNIFLGRIHSSL